MDMSYLAEKMLEWEKLQRRADELKAMIIDTVLHIEKTQTVGNVRASYNKGRKKYDYEKAALESPLFVPEMKDVFSKATVDWRAICKEIDAEVPFEQSEPSVTVKLLA